MSWVCMSIRSRVRRFELAPLLNHSGAGPSSRIDGKALLFTTECHTPPSRQDLAVAKNTIARCEMEEIIHVLRKVRRR